MGWGMAPPGSTGIKTQRACSLTERSTPSARAQSGGSQPGQSWGQGTLEMPGDVFEIVTTGDVLPASKGGGQQCR